MAPVAAAPPGDEDAQRDAFRSAMQRAAEKHREGQRSRAAMARMARPKLDVQEGPSWSVIFPVAVAALWVLNFAIFGAR